MPKICGMTVALGKLFLLRHMSSNIEVYDTNTLTRENDLLAKIFGLPRDIAACATNRYCYISERNTGFLRRVGFHVVDTSMHSTRVELLEEQHKQWKVDGCPNGLSVTPALNVLVACDDDRTLKEYDSDGNHLRLVLLPADMDRPHHAICLLPSCDVFLVCHGGWSSTTPRACVVRCTTTDAGGSNGHLITMTGSVDVKEVYGGIPGSEVGQLMVPLRLAMAMMITPLAQAKGQQRNIFVVDFKNFRVVLLRMSINVATSECSLSYDSCLLAPGTDGKQFSPERLCLDEAGRKLYVSDDNNLVTFSRKDGDDLWELTA